jgi:hypothetical protein
MEKKAQIILSERQAIQEFVRMIESRKESTGFFPDSLPETFQTSS